MGHSVSVCRCPKSNICIKEMPNILRRSKYVVTKTWSPSSTKLILEVLGMTSMEICIIAFLGVCKKEF